MPPAVTYCEPAPTTDAGRVLAMIRANPGRPSWWLAAERGLSRQAIRSATHHLKARGLVHARPVVQPQPSTGVLYPIPCWYPGPPAATRTPTTDTHCRVSMGMGHQCGTRLEFTITALGVVRASCPACRRRDAGWCRTCPQRIDRPRTTGPAPWFCAACLLQRRRARRLAKYRTPAYRATHAREERRRVRAQQEAACPAT